MRLHPSRRRALRARLLRWYAETARDLPWRRSADAYRVWLSEIMLQQTQVKVVVPYFERFLARFPTIDHLAAADEEAVLAAWQGLGYYGRARRLHSAAREVVESYGGVFPDDERQALSLAGIGRYTAGAILSIAYGRPLPVVDGNVARVLIRLEAMDGNLDDAATRAALWDVASDLVPAERPGDWNQALMELGALVCTPQAPSCGVCPMQSSCRAQKRGIAASLPPPRARRSAPVVPVAVAWIERDGAVACVQRGAGQVNACFWELPSVDLDGADAALTLRARLGAAGMRHVRVGPAVTDVEHGMFHRRAQMTVHVVTGDGGDWRWIDPQAESELPITTASRKVMKRTVRALRQGRLALDDKGGGANRRRQGVVGP